MKRGHRMAAAGFLMAAVIFSCTQTSCRKQRAPGIPKAIAVATNGELRLRLMTLNVRYENAAETGERSWRNRIPGIVRMIREEAPDIIGVQEALHGQAADLWASLPDYEFHGVAREDGDRAGEYSGIFHLRDRFEVSEGGFFWLSDTPHKAGSATWGNTIPRVAVWRCLTDRASQQSFRIYNTHWDHKNQESRLKSGELMRHHIMSRPDPEEALIVLGDFNAIESNPALLRLRGASMRATSQLVDTFQALHAEEKRRTTLHFWRGRRDGFLKVDHIFTSQPVRVISSGIRDQDQPMLSDHFPVVAEVSFPKR